MNIQDFLTNILKFMNDTLVPFILAVAFLVFIWNVTRYFILNGGNSESQERARLVALWGITAFVIILSLWGVVNLLVTGFGLGGGVTKIPDYMCSKFWGDCGNESPGPSGNTGVSGWIGEGDTVNPPPAQPSWIGEGDTVVP